MELSYQASVDEFVNRVFERYQLDRFGVLQKEDLINRLYEDKLLENDYRSGNLNAFRTRALKPIEQAMARFRFGDKEALLFDFFFVIMKRVVNELHSKNGDSELDKEIEALPRTIAYKASRFLLQESLIPPLQFRAKLLSPYDIEMELKRESRSLYPVNIDLLTSQLRKEDPDFWAELSIVLKKISAWVTWQITQNMELDQMALQDLKSDAWIDGLEKTKILLPQQERFESGKHLYNFMRKVTLNAALNLRKRVLNHQDLNVSLEALPDPEIVSPEIDEEVLGFDLQNKYEARQALVQVLYLGEGPVYDKLTEGMDNEMQLFQMRIKENLSYEEIVLRLHEGESLSKGEKKREEARCRKIVERTKKEMVARFARYAGIPSL